MSQEMQQALSSENKLQFIVSKKMETPVLNNHKKLNSVNNLNKQETDTPLEHPERI